MYQLNKGASIEIFNSLGILVTRQSLAELNTKINLNEYSNGIYFVLIKGKQPSRYLKIIKE